MNTETNTTGNVVKKTTFNSEGDWINKVIAKYCTSETGAVAEVKDKDGKVSVRAKKATVTTDVSALEQLAIDNHLTPKTYVNPGMARMNIGNMLRAAARKRHGLNIAGRFKRAPEDFTADLGDKTEKPDGTKIAKKPPAKATA